MNEMLELSVKSIDSNKILIKLEQSKGTKDRYVMLSEKLLSLLR
ncbi:MAG: tyrosine-type recombinase/integrase [Desulfobulbaceae bacterium]|nr:tyrosine-type recombinase/integrase [Desulfobulbaceae bacterium]